MTKITELQEQLDDALDALSTAEDTIEKMKKSASRKTNDYKKKLKAGFKANEKIRQESFADAKKAGKKIVRKANKKLKELRSVNRDLIGIPGLAALDAQIELLQELF